MRNDLHVTGIYDLKNFLTCIAQKEHVSFVAYICMCLAVVFITKQKSLGGVKHWNEKKHSSSQNPLGEKTT